MISNTPRSLRPIAARSGTSTKFSAHTSERVRAQDRISVNSKKVTRESVRLHLKFGQGEEVRTCRTDRSPKALISLRKEMAPRTVRFANLALRVSKSTCLVNHTDFERPRLT